MARVGAVVLGCAALANCSAAKVFGDKYSPRVVADGEPVPKGGGVYRVGQPYNINGQTYFPADSPSYRAEGIASWYGPDFHGRLTANGEVFDMHGISAAHPTMPLPSYARVTNLANARSIIVRVNDRGPYARNRIIDVSIGAANALGFYGNGLARVRVEYVGRAPLEGSDDRVLLATLREGLPAQVPAQLMVASAAPFVPSFADEGGETPIPPERPFALGATSGRLAGKPATVNVASADAVAERSVVKVPAGRAQRVTDLDSAAGPGPLATTYAPLHNDGVLGLMSGRGLY
ncbi:MAG TPA: septal ring lytic transglycosylase RlpA family protein [Xanthobacteraceae bacterium]|jgi:rare lipoprotein A